MAGLRIYSDEERRERKREANKKYRESRPEEQTEERKAANRIRKNARQKLIRKPMTPEQKVAKRAYDLAYMALLTDEQRVERTARSRARDKIGVDNLHDRYIKNLLRGVGFVSPPPPELIELKRVQLKIRRYLNQGEQT